MVDETSLCYPPENRRLLVAGSIFRIISGLDVRKPLHAVGVNLGNPVLDGCALHFVLDFPTPEGAFECDELSLLEGFGELRAIAPGIDAVPFGAILVVSLVVLPAFLSCDTEDDVLAVVLSSFGVGVLSEAGDEVAFVLFIE